MPELNEYEIEDHNGIVTTVQLSEEDVKRFPHARKVSKHGKQSNESGDLSATNQQQHEHGQAQNRARQSK